MKCYACKEKIPEGSRFCPKCGKPQFIDQKLIDAANAGDQEAITDLYVRTRPSVYSTVKFLVKDEDTTQDILQDSYIKAFDSLAQLQDAEKFEPWIRRIAHNRAVDYLRKVKPVTFSAMVPDDSDEVLEFEDKRPESLPEVVIDRNETSRLLNEILYSLPEEQRIVVSLYYYEQLSVKEIASELGIPEATVKSRLLYGRKKIEEKVKALEKKGTKLYSLAPIPFLLLLFREQAQAAEEAPSGELERILTRRSGKSSAGDGLSAGERKASEETAAGKEMAADQDLTAGKGLSTGKESALSSASATSGTGSALGSASALETATHTAASALLPKILATVTAVAVLAGGGTALVRHFRQTTPEPAAIETTAAIGTESAATAADTETILDQATTEEASTVAAQTETGEPSDRASQAEANASSDRASQAETRESAAGASQGQAETEALSPLERAAQAASAAADRAAQEADTETGNHPGTSGNTDPSGTGSEEDAIVPLSDYLLIVCRGSEGSMTARGDFDFLAFEDAVEEVYGHDDFPLSDVLALELSLKMTLTPDANLKTGDTVTMTATYSEKAAKAFGLPVDGIQKTFIVG